VDYIDKTLLQEAASLVEGDRGATYGPPTAVFDAIGLAWSAILSPLLRDDVLIDGEHVAICMAALKLVRQSVGKPKRDNLVDTVGYILALDHVERSR
jgi:hypothetical protein